MTGITTDQFLISGGSLVGARQFRRWFWIMAGQGDLLSASLHSDRGGLYSGWSAGMPLPRAVGWRGDQGRDEVICNTPHTQTRAPDQQTLQITGWSPTNLTHTPVNLSCPRMS